MESPIITTRPDLWSQNTPASSNINPVMGNSSITSSSNIFPLHKLPDELVYEIFSHLPQEDRLNLTLLNKKYYHIAIQLLYKRMYLNDSNVIKSDFMNLAINWTLLKIPSYLVEEVSRKIANLKLTKLIRTLESNKEILNSIEWIRINWDLNSTFTKKILKLLCDGGKSLKRLENVTDPNCNDIIALGKESKSNLISFDMAPPNSLPELNVSDDYLPNLAKYMKQRISTNLSYMTLFIDPIVLFNNLYPLKNKLQIIDLKLHWRREFYDFIKFTKSSISSHTFEMNQNRKKLTKLSDIFDIRSLKTLTIISWNESLLQREIEMLKEFKEFIYLQDLSLISIKQDIPILVELFKNLTNLKRLKMDFLEDYIPEPTNSQIFLSILLNCKKLQFIDLRFENIDLPIINISDELLESESSTDSNNSSMSNNVNKFKLIQKCHCHDCNKVFDNILREKIFKFEEDYQLHDINDIATKDIFKMMRYLSLLPYSKACDNYPSVRTQPMNLEQFVIKMNDNLLAYRKSRSQLVPYQNITSVITPPANNNNNTNIQDYNTNNNNNNNYNNNDQSSSLFSNNPPIYADEYDDEDVDMLRDEYETEQDYEYAYEEQHIREHENTNENTNEVDQMVNGNDRYLQLNPTITSSSTVSLSSTTSQQRRNQELLTLPHDPLTESDVIDCYHALIHHYRKTYLTFLRGFPNLRFLMLNDIPMVSIEKGENNEKILEPVFYHGDFKSNLFGWSDKSNNNKNKKKNLANTNNANTRAKKAIVS
ncbi:SCF ubiquitin ligase complex subunit DAS1 NDAI_0G06270 [Naumovozyma dairenensis CBS 421]|uniref:F-box domain-containing protein n=1 Tax=Naumovozyma dairenensis (strain ATCC 10597 / BCRC 20456 / CBS 421 / NBRC 0211 / NRRL Y-12639) TaxID=1071378 RepID=J7SBV5_NAUDC|nr:hypothetical protein NDAI_0G06270 [Naumovozyma dairenensis CBS 421]CCK73610.1 hypothetical protein NDAI_0G06270 [Naumovozyma dairenensis CBS 421]